jgi:site-specific DNA recombinase
MQDKRSLEDQRHLCLEFLQREFHCKIEVKEISSVAKGELLDRDELRQIEEEIDSGKYDIVICEDLGRIVRRLHGLLICEMCEDVGTRLIAINDRIDMANDGWKLAGHFAVIKHEHHNEDTAARVHRTHRSRFGHGQLGSRVWGYLGWDLARTDSDLRKDPACERPAAEVMRRLKEGAPWAEIADWLHENEVVMPPRSRKRRWDGTLAAQVFRNPILKGVREHNNVTTKRVNRTGRRTSVKASPEELQTRSVPHLAYYDPIEFDGVHAAIRLRNSGKGRPKIAGRDMRAGMPRKRTIWPLQHARCGPCGRPYWRGACGDKLVGNCSGSLTYRCWNGQQLSLADVQRFIIDAVLHRVQSIGDIRSYIAPKIEDLLKNNDLQTSIQKLTLRRAQKITSIEKLIDMGMIAPDVTSIAERLKDAQQELQQIEYELRTKEKQCSPTSYVIPENQELVQYLGTAMQDVINRNSEACRLMNAILPKVTIYPVQLVNEKAVESRAEVELDIEAAIAGLTGRPAAEERSCEVLQIDLFEMPAYVKHAHTMGTCEGRGEPVLKAAQRLGLTFPTAFLARRLHKFMIDSGLTNLYRRIDQPPKKGWRCRRHRNHRYRFEPLEDHEMD